MGQVRDKMLCDLKLKRYSLSTINNYLRVGSKLAEYFWLSPKQLELPQVQQFLLHLIDDKKIGPAGRPLRTAGPDSARLARGLLAGRAAPKALALSGFPGVWMRHS